MGSGLVDLGGLGDLVDRPGGDVLLEVFEGAVPGLGDLGGDRLGLRKVRLLTNNPKKTDAFIYGGFDLEVVDQIPIMPPMNEYNARYLATKRDKLGHHLPKE